METMIDDMGNILKIPKITGNGPQSSASEGYAL